MFVPEIWFACDQRRVLNVEQSSEQVSMSSTSRATTVSDPGGGSSIGGCWSRERWGCGSKPNLRHPERIERRERAGRSLGAERLGWCRCHHAVLVHDDHLACVVF